MGGCINMDGMTAISHIRRKFQQAGSHAEIPMQKRGTFKAELKSDGIMVNNLGNQPFLPWIVFQEAICALIRKGGHASRGNAMNARLGDPDLSLDSIEGHIAQVVYGKKIDETVFSYKSIVTKRINQILNSSGAPLWQRNYKEHIVRNDGELNAILRYIPENTLKWELDQDNLINFVPDNEVFPEVPNGKK